MTLDEIVLQKLTDWRAPSQDRHTCSVVDESSGWAIAFTVDRHDDLSSALWEVTLRRTRAAADSSSAALEAWAHAAADRVTGLLEPLRVVEIDRPRSEALLRSEDPSRRGGNLYYYEVLLKSTQEAVMRRYRAQPTNGPREQIPFTLTHEALAKVTSDLAAAS
jgi:hypothetical protein